jgi:hypothetical protein
MATIGGFTNKPTGRSWFLGRPVEGSVPASQLRGRDSAAKKGDRHVFWAGLDGTALPPASQKTCLSPFFAQIVPAIWWDWRGGNPSWWWGLKALIFELIRSYHYVAGLPMLVGLWWFRDRLRWCPGMWVLFVLGSLHCVVLCRVAEVVGYISERHVQMLVLFGSFWAVAMNAAVGDRLAVLTGWRWLSPLLLLALVGSSCPGMLKPLHANRAGHRAAGDWLAQHTLPQDNIIDPFCWAHFYAGRVFQEGKPLADPPPDYHSHCYVVLEDSSNPHERLPVMKDAVALAQKGKLVYEWQPAKRSRDQSGIRVYQVPPE